jgi:beta-ribofuranosylaminobenzene 5'-phosphate synthase
MERVSIKTPSRLHFSLIDLEGGLGRMDGGVGVALSEPGVELSVEKADGLSVVPKNDLAKQVAKKTLDSLNLPGARVEVKRIIPEHVGLGSTTQLSLAIASSIAKVYGAEKTVTELALIVGRGGTSGIGVEAFARGGFILDGGHSKKEKGGFSPSRFSKAAPPPVLVRYPFPKDWYFLCVLPEVKGAHGQGELDIFKKYCPILPTQVEAVSRAILMGMLPAVVEADLKAFGDSINRLQKLGFKKVEISLQDKVTRRVLRFLQENSAGAGMSSFGPLCYALMEGNEEALRLEDEARRWMNNRGFKFTTFVTNANNTGARWR